VEEWRGRLDGWAAANGGRAPALRRLMDEATSNASPIGSRLPARPVKLTIRLTAEDASGLDVAAAEAGLTRNAWVAALVRRRLSRRPTFDRGREVPLVAIHAELRRIGVNVNQIARAMNTAVLVGHVLDLEIAYLDDLRREMHGHLLAVREAFAGNLAYWDGPP